MKWTQEQLAEISTLQEKHSLTRKSAVQRFRRQLKVQGTAAPAQPESGKPDKPAAPAPKPAAKAKKAKDRPADKPAATEIPRVVPETTLELRPVDGVKAHTALVHGRKAVVAFQERNRAEASHRFDGVALSTARMEACKKLAKTESLPLYVGLQVRVGGKLDQGYLVTYDLWHKLTNDAGDFLLNNPARLAYQEGGMVGIRFEFAKK
jgi:hypothetical protein